MSKGRGNAATCPVDDCGKPVKPLAKGGAHMLANFRPICAPCNLRKGARWPFGSADITAIGTAA